MIEKMLAMYLAPTLLVLFILVVIVHDKMIERRAKKKAWEIMDSGNDSGDQKVSDTKPNLKQQVITSLSTLPDDASLRDIGYAINQAAVETVPDDIYDLALEVFENEKSAVGWLTSDVVALCGQSPIEVLQQDDGKELVVTILERIRHGVYS